MDPFSLLNSRSNKINLALETEHSGFEMAPCTRCRNARTKPDESKPKCIVGPRSGRCSECIRKGYPKCDVTLSRPEWEKVRDVRERLRKQLTEATEAESSVYEQLARQFSDLAKRKAKVARLRKQLALAERRTDDAVAREVLDLEMVELLEEEFLPSEEVVGVEAELVPSGDFLELPPDFWNDVSGGADPVVPESSEDLAVL